MLTFNFHIGDWLKKTVHLADTEKAVYLALLCRYYDTEEPIPAAEIYRIAMARTPEQRTAVDYVLDEFFLLDGDSWRQTRCDEEIELYQVRSEKAKASARVRWDKSKDANAMRTHTGRNANASSEHSDRMPPSNAPAMLTNNHEPLTTNQETNIPKPGSRRKPALGADALIALGVGQQVAADFMTHRKAKKAPITQTVLDGIVAEGQLAGWPIELVLRTMILRNWQGFKAKWVQDEKPQPSRHSGFDQRDYKAGVSEDGLF